ncbi:hypothetical protein NDQ72_08195 [Halomonas sp. KG2]|uniref:hypothetical protein n=1 Tax=Halomonas sp. KG2 TaxID=2951138 RepID=UPI002647CEA6|nr:hypothetical protein [Halomonas sp. KG2]WKD29909.1 hypothetical protein NDQ72_08195 [Halomonas sp. KG2]
MDQELEAMQAVYTALSDLSDEERTRVLAWVTAKFGLSPSSAPVSADTRVVATPQQQQSPDSAPSEEPVVERDEPEDVADLYTACSPSTNADKVLVVGYWHQVICGDESLTSAKVNQELKHLGHGIKRMNDAFSSLISSKPQLAIQTRRSGSSQQARKTYKLTREGINRVNSMIAGTLNNDSN